MEVVSKQVRRHLNRYDDVMTLAFCKNPVYAVHTITDKPEFLGQTEKQVICFKSPGSRYTRHVPLVSVNLGHRKQFRLSCGLVLPQLRVGNDRMRQASHLLLQGHKGQATAGVRETDQKEGNWVYNLRAHLHRTDITVGAKKKKIVTNKPLL